MLNCEKWKDKLKKLEYVNDGIAVNHNGIPVSCGQIDCSDCIFNNDHKALSGCNSENLFDWLCKEYKEPEIDWDKDIDWMKVPVGTEVLVKDSNVIEWGRRKFAVYLPEAFRKKYIAFSNGETQYDAKGVCDWAYCKLIKPEDIEKYRKR